MKLANTLLFGLTILLLTQSSAFSQCETWVGKSNEEDITTWHSVYRPYIKSQDYASAFEYWEQAYKAAPAADGKRDFHYTDGIKIFKDRFTKETDAEKKKEYAAEILRLYDEAISCYQNKVIKRKCVTEKCYNQFISDLYGRKGYDMYYTLRTPYPMVLEAFDKAIEYGGNQTGYIVVAPMASVAVYQYQKEKIDKVATRAVHDKLAAVCDSKIGSSHKYAAYYEQAKGAMEGEFNKVKYEIFDCAYHKEDNMVEYKENIADPVFAKDLYNKLKVLGCDPSDEFMKELEQKWGAYAAEENARRQAEFEANNPGMMAKKAYDAGDFEGAIDKFREAAAGETDESQKAGYHFSIASIMFRKLNQYSNARSEARKAADMRPGWGKPYDLIGDMYGSSASSCGDAWNQSLAVLAAIKMWSQAKSMELEPEELESVNKKIRTYQKSKPDKEEGFMKGIRPGTQQRVGCWIGETVAVSYR